jgi:predicted peptidase
MPIRRLSLAVFAAFVLFALATAVVPQPAVAGGAKEGEGTKTGFLNKEYEGVKYVVFVPHVKKAGEKYPVILFLHGSGESGTDGVKQTKQGIGNAIRKHEKTFPFLTVMPQSQKGGWKASSEEGKRAIAILDSVMKEYDGDPKRTYLTGLSMGGMGTWSFAIAHPDRWAAIVPICGRGDVSQADKIAKIPCWDFHGDADTSVNVEGSRKMIAALKEAGGEPKYTEYPGVGHNSWDQAYGTAELYTWLLQQKAK